MSSSRPALSLPFPTAMGDDSRSHAPGRSRRMPDESRMGWSRAIKAARRLPQEADGAGRTILEVQADLDFADLLVNDHLVVDSIVGVPHFHQVEVATVAKALILSRQRRLQLLDDVGEEGLPGVNRYHDAASRAA